MSNWIPLTGPGSRIPTREDANEARYDALKMWFANVTARIEAEKKGQQP